MPDVRDLGRAMKAKYPGAYDSVDDAVLGRAVQAKYPGSYTNFADTQADTGIPSQAMTPAQYSQVARTEKARQAYEQMSLPERIAQRFQDSIASGVPMVVGNVAKLGSALGIDTSALQAYNERRANEIATAQAARPQNFATNTAGAILGAAPLAAAGFIAGEAGVPALLAGGGVAAASADYSNPAKAATQIALGAVLPKVGGAIGSRLGGGIAGEIAGGAGANMLGTAGEQLAFEGQINPSQVLQSGIVGAALTLPAIFSASPKEMAQISSRIRAGDTVADVVKLLGPAPEGLPNSPIYAGPSSVAELPSSPAQQAIIRFQSGIQDIDSSNLSPAQKANAFSSLVKAVAEEAQPTPKESMVQVQFPRNQFGYGPLMRMPGEPIGTITGFEPIPGSPAAMGAVTSKPNVALENLIRADENLPMLPDFNPPKIGTKLIEPSFEVGGGRTGPYTETVGPSLREVANFEAKPTEANTIAAADKTRFFDALVPLYRAGLLSNPTTLLKSITGKALYQVAEQASRIPASIADMATSLFTGRRTLTGPSVGSIGQSIAEAATKGLSEAWNVLKNGDTSAVGEAFKSIHTGDTIFNKALDAYANYVPRAYGAEAKIFETFAARNALQEQARATALTEARKGLINRGEIGQRQLELLRNPTPDMVANALFEGKSAVFSNDNFISTFLQGGARTLPKPAKMAVDVLLPFKKVPSNIILKALEYTPLGAGKAATQAAYQVANKAFTPAAQRAFSQTIGRSSVGTGLMLLGYTLYQRGLMTGLPSEDRTIRARDEAAGRLPGAILVNGTWHQIAGFSPIGDIMALGATIGSSVQTEADKARRQGEPPPNTALSIAKGFAAGAGELATKQPLLETAENIRQGIRQPGTTGARVVGNLAGSVVPGAVASIAGATDSSKRETQTILSRVENRIPGLRQTLPTAQDVLGRDIQQVNPLNPMKSTTPRTDAIYSELVRLNIGISGIAQKKGESQESHRAKVQSFGELFRTYGSQLVSSPEYQQASRNEQEKAVELLNSRAKALVERGTQDYAEGPLNAQVLMSTASSHLLRKQLKAELLNR